MGQLIIIPSGQAGALGIEIGEDVIAYYPFEEVDNLKIIKDCKHNFDGETARDSRVEGYVLQGLPVIKTGTKNFEVNKVLDEIPATKKFSVELWFNLSEKIVVGEHRTYTILSKQWTSGMRLYAYFISRLESVQLHICFEYKDIDAVSRTESTYVTIPQGYVLDGKWHRCVVQLDLRDGTDTTGEAWYSKFGVYFITNAGVMYYACKDTEYFLNIPMNFALEPQVIGGDLTNFKLATNDSTIPIIVDGLPFSSSDRYGLEGIIDEVIIRQVLKEELYGCTERPRLYVVILGPGTVIKEPEQTSYLPNNIVTLTAIPNEGCRFRRWRIAEGTIQSGIKEVYGSVNTATYNSELDNTTIEIKEDLVPNLIPIIPDDENWKLVFTSGALIGQEFNIIATTDDELDTITVAGDASEAIENDTFYCYSTEQNIEIKEDLVPVYISSYSDSEKNYKMKMTSGVREGEYFNIVSAIDGTPDIFRISGNPHGIASDDTFIITIEDNPTTVTIPQIDRTVYAEFGGEYKITVSVSGNGYVVINPEKEDYGPNEEVELTAIPTEGWYFARWEGDISGSDNPETVIMDDNKDITAVFLEKEDHIYIVYESEADGEQSPEVSDVIYIVNEEEE